MDYKEVYEQWLSNPYFDDATKEELKNIAEDDNEIKERFYMDLEFGTAGLRGIIGAGTSSDKQLYMLLNTEEYTNYPYETKGLGENMALVSQVISGWWKPRFLLNHNTKCAYEFMDSNEKLTTVTQDDIAWDTLYGIPKIAIERDRKSVV